MYLDYFGLAEAPFSIAPDPHFLYLSQRHQEALAHLLYGVNGDGGFVLLTGEVGSGKTTICRCLLEQVPEICDVAYIFNPKLTAEELLSTICMEFGIAYAPGNTSVKVFIDVINAHLLDAHAKGRRTILIIDEAQNLAIDVLEQMRLLTNLETNQHKLLQIILIGQPELVTLLARPELRQLSQRIVARYHLDPLSKSEISAYVRHRLDISGGKIQLVPESLMARLYRLSGGVPRLINVLCDRALLGAYVQGKERVDRATLEQAAREVLHQPLRQSRTKLWLGTASLTLALGLAWWLSTVLQTPPVANFATTGAASAKPFEATQSPANKQTTRSEWPDGERIPESNRALAETTLFQAWKLEYQAGKDFCRQAKKLGFACHEGQGKLSDLRVLNRPAMLKMRTAGGHEFWTILITLSDQDAQLRLGEQTKIMGLQALGKYWTGQYTLLWRLPPEVSGKLQAGDRGEGVRWLAEQIGRWQGHPSEAVKLDKQRVVFDRNLVREVKAFQVAHGLIPDGTAGRQTLMYLVSNSEQRAPTLMLAAAPQDLETKASLALKTALELSSPRSPPASSGKQ